MLDDTRYAELWIRSRLSSKKKITPLWLLGSLAKKGISRNSRQKALEKTLDPETEYHLLLNYLGTANIEETSATKAWLKKEGFSPEVIGQFYSI